MMTWRFFQVVLHLTKVIQYVLVITLYLQGFFEFFAEMIFSVFKNLFKKLTHIVYFDGMVVAGLSPSAETELITNFHNFLDRHHAWRSLDPTLGLSSPFVKKRKKAF